MTLLVLFILIGVLIVNGITLVVVLDRVDELRLKIDQLILLLTREM